MLFPNKLYQRGQSVILNSRQYYLWLRLLFLIVNEKQKQRTPKSYKLQQAIMCDYEMPPEPITVSNTVDIP